VGRAVSWRWRSSRLLVSSAAAVSLLMSGVVSAAPAWADAATYTFSGSVTGPGQVVEPGATVDVKKVSDDSVVGETTTGADGTYAVTFDTDGPVYELVSPPAGSGLVPSQTGHLDPAAVSGDVDVVLYSSLHVAGSVYLDGAGADLTHGQVYGNFDQDQLTQSPTDVHGFAVTTSAGSHNVGLHGTFTNNVASTINFDLYAGASLSVSTQLDLAIPATAVHTSIFDPSGNPVSGCSLSTYVNGVPITVPGLAGPSISMSTGLRFSGSTADIVLLDTDRNVNVYVSCTGYPTKTLTVAPHSSNTLNVTLPAASHITGAVTLAGAGFDQTHGQVYGNFDQDQIVQSTTDSHAFTVTTSPGTHNVGLHGTFTDNLASTINFDLYAGANPPNGDSQLPVPIPVTAVHTSVINRDGDSVPGCSLNTYVNGVPITVPGLDGPSISMSTGLRLTGSAADVVLLDTTRSINMYVYCTGYPTKSLTVAPHSLNTLTVTLPAVSSVTGLVSLDGAGTDQTYGQVYGNFDQDQIVQSTSDQHAFTATTSPGTHNVGLHGTFTDNVASTINFDLYAGATLPEGDSQLPVPLPMSNVHISVVTHDGTPIAGCSMNSYVNGVPITVPGLDGPSLSLSTGLRLSAGGTGDAPLSAGSRPVNVNVSCPNYPTASGTILPANVDTLVIEYDGASSSFHPVTRPRVVGTVHGTRSNGWYKDDVSVTWTATTTDPTLEPVSQPADTSVTTEGRNQVITSGPACDSAGTCSTGTVRVSIDKTAPTADVSLSSATPDGANGWFKTAPLAKFRCSDAIAGVLSCPAAQLVPDGTASTVTGSATDVAGNVSATVATDPVNVDTHGPELTYTTYPAAPDQADGSYSYLTVHWNCTDATSGVATCPQDQTLEPGNDQTVTGTATDVAGNSTTVTAGPFTVGIARVTVTVNLRDADGNVLPGLTVDLDHSGPYTEDANGTVTFAVDKGTSTSSIYVLSYDGASRFSVQTKRSYTFDSDQTIDLTLPTRPGTVNVKLHDGTPATGCRTQIVQDGGYGDDTWYERLANVEFGPPDNQGTIDSAGNVRFAALYDGTTRLTVYCPAPGNNGSWLHPSNSVVITRDGDGIFRYTLPADPNIVGTVIGQTAHNGWYRRTPVTVHWTITNYDSSWNPTFTAPPDSVLRSEGADQVVTSEPFVIGGWYQPGTVHLNVDTSRPSLSYTLDKQPGGNGWYGKTTVHWSCSDATSGIDSCPADQTLPEGTSVTVTGTATDVAGNTRTITTPPVNVDLSNPSLSYTLTPGTADGSNGWYTHPVTVHWTCTDDASGIATCPSDQTLNMDGATLTATGTATDNAGNSTSVTTDPIQLDQAAPTITATATPTANSLGWNRTDVTVHFTCTDATSKISSCPTDQTVTGETPAAGTTVTGTAVDNAGLTTTTQVTVKIDKGAPVITAVAARAPDRNGWYNKPVDVTFTCADATSGIDTCQSTVPVTADSGPAGRPVAGTAVDNAGNSSVSNTVTVKLDTTGPVITAAPDRAPNTSGWYSGPVTWHFTCTDTGGSGVYTCPADVTISGSGTGQTRIVQGVDVAGNATSFTTPAVKIDNDDPRIAFTNGGATVKQAGDSVGGSAKDVTSGVTRIVVTWTNSVGTLVKTSTFTYSPTPGGTVGWSTPVPTTSGQYTVSAVAYDQAGRTGGPASALVVTIPSITG
jgi:hypothetical protein